MIVMKFGGTSVGNAERIQNVCELVQRNLAEKPIIVVSAIGGITDKLLNAGREAIEGNMHPFDEISLIHSTIVHQLHLDQTLVQEKLAQLLRLLKEIAQKKELTLQTTDQLSSFGERLSAKIVAASLVKNKIPAQSFCAWEIGLLTDSNFGSALPLPESDELIKEKLLSLSITPVITGFIAHDKRGRITTLGRGGSDYSAAIIGAAMECREIQIWTDVDGVMTTDPRIVKHAQTNPQVSFMEAAEMAYFGAKVLHPSTILPAVDKNIPVRVLNTFKPQAKGTLILKETGKQKSLKCIACKKNITIITISSARMLNAYGFLAKIFEVFKKYKKSVDLIATTEVSVSLTIDNEDKLTEIMNELREFGEVSVKRERVSISLIGDGLIHTKGIAGRIFSVVGNQGVNIEMITQGSSEINVSFVVKKEEYEKAVSALHHEFFE